MQLGNCINLKFVLVWLDCMVQCKTNKLMICELRKGAVSWIQKDAPVLIFLYPSQLLRCGLVCINHSSSIRGDTAFLYQASSRKWFAFSFKVKNKSMSAFFRFVLLKVSVCRNSSLLLWVLVHKDVESHVLMVPLDVSAEFHSVGAMWGCVLNGLQLCILLLLFFVLIMLKSFL